MARLFDAESEEKKAAEIREERARVRRRAEEAEEALKELEEVDRVSQGIQSLLAAQQAVTAIVYREYRRPGSKWLIEHSAAGEDYMFQLHPLRPPAITVKEVIGQAITAMDVIFPRSQEIYYVPPNPQYSLQFYTIKVEKLVGKPGWQGAVERALEGLSQIVAWPRPPAR